MKFPANHFLGAQRNGVNHVSMNVGTFGPNGPVRGTNYPVYSDALLDWYQTKGMGSVRLMFSWEAVQSTLGGPVPAPGANYAVYWADLIDVLIRLLARGLMVTLAPWQYNSISGDTDIVYANAPISPPSFADFWRSFAAAVNTVTGNDQRVAFDLINEPHTHEESGNKPGDLGISLPQWFLCAQAAITEIRKPAPIYTNTIFVPGVGYAAASKFVDNGSAAGWLALTDPTANLAVTVHCYSGLGSSKPTALRDACAGVVGWARTYGVKVQIGEIALDAGPNGTATYGSTFATAQAQWADWQQFCLQNDDVLIGWNWWGNSAPGWWNQGDSYDPAGYHWGLTLNDGATQTVYADLIDASFVTPRLAVLDNSADSGMGPNATTPVGWESPDIWVRQTADGGLVGEPILGGRPCVVYVRIHNRGNAPYPISGTDVLQLYWAKANAGLSWPNPWSGSNPSQGDIVAPAQHIGATGSAQATVLSFNWVNTPNPAGYPGNDGHFCLLAVVTKADASPFDGFKDSDLNQNVLDLSHVAWRNIHIIPVAMRLLGELVVANHTTHAMNTQVTFELLDARGRPAGEGAEQFILLPHDAALARIRDLDDPNGNIEDLGEGAYRLLDPTAGIDGLALRSGEHLRFGLEWAPDDGAPGHAVRATQYALEAGERIPIGGQTFVIGQVDGWSSGTAE
ncbi:glycoside hydrolase family 5 protein [Kribbella sp. NBC_01510]|uniref:glycoside hydrolase family 5 protein n=1 Tax=Kribbella sp. NBC_01510 TaxID=2903581 RepID=UPI00386871DB